MKTKDYQLAAIKLEIFSTEARKKVCEVRGVLYFIHKLMMQNEIILNKIERAIFNYEQKLKS